MVDNLFEKNFLLAEQPDRTVFEYKMLFASSIAPHHSNSLNLFAQNAWDLNSKLPSKYYIKNSYLMLSWFYYLKLVTYDSDKLGSESGSLKDKKHLIRFAVLPSKRAHYTLTKAPMAHKTNSKEQFEFKFYFTLATFRGVTESGRVVNSCDAAAALLLVSGKLFPTFSTNVLFLKTSRVFFTYHDRSFFNYYLFTVNYRR